MSSMWELKQWNVQVNLLKINYKIVLKAVRHLYKQMSWTGELFCPLRVTVHRGSLLTDLAICYQLQLSLLIAELEMN